MTCKTWNQIRVWKGCDRCRIIPKEDGENARVAGLLCRMRKEKGHGGFSVQGMEKEGEAVIPVVGTGKLRT